MNWELVRGGPLWRIVTCHFTHFTYERLAWDGIAFLALSAACLRRDAKTYFATLLASVMLVPLAVLAFSDVDVYRGLSGIDSALFALLIASDKRLRFLFVAFAAKLAFELAPQSTVFVTHMGAGVVSVPIAHAAGAMVGIVAALPKMRAWSESVSQSQ